MKMKITNNYPLFLPSVVKTYGKDTNIATPSLLIDSKIRFAETRKAKLRLSNIKIEEITQVLRGKSKFIKH